MIEDYNYTRKIEKDHYINIGFVCSGNTCRSYMAEAIATHLLKTVYYKKVSCLKDRVSISSAGTSVTLGKITRNSYRTLELLEIPNLKSTPTPIDAPLVRNSDLILVMSISHKNEIIRNFDHFDTNKIFTLVELSNIVLYFQTEKIYRRSFINKGEYIFMDELDKCNLPQRIRRIGYVRPDLPSGNLKYERHEKIIDESYMIDAIKDKIFRLKNINREILLTATNLDIEDPFGKPINEYYKVAQTIKEKILTIFDYLFIESE
ncbi:MAG: hypothetical protein H5T85_04910 [Actinobacteria bacterium]|nr:hypothetical protein [Actinomycetota bacterium]